MRVQEGEGPQPGGQTAGLMQRLVAQATLPLLLSPLR